MAQSNSRSPRRMHFEHPALAKKSISTDKPPEDSISWRLWTQSNDLAEQALASDYVQGIKNGTLHPDAYGGYTVQDAAYCFNARADYETVERRATADGDAELADFAKARADSYASYNESFCKQWHLKGGDAVIPAAAAQTYIDFEHHVAHGLSPIYGVVAMIPCDELWSWLATELKPFAGDGNLYGFWIEDNDDWHGAYRLDNFIDDWFAAHPDVYDWDTALYVMRSCMTCEVNFFRSAGGQDLLPMPSKPSALSG